MKKAEKQALWEYNLAKVYNKAKEEAAFLANEMLEEEDGMHPVAQAIYDSQVPFRPHEVEALFTRRNKLLDLQNYPKFQKLTPEQEEEQEILRKEIAKLPTGYNVEDQKARDSIYQIVDRIKRRKELGYHSLELTAEELVLVREGVAEWFGTPSKGPAGLEILVEKLERS